MTIFQLAKSHVVLDFLHAIVVLLRPRAGLDRQPAVDTQNGVEYERRRQNEEHDDQTAVVLHPPHQLRLHARRQHLSNPFHAKPKL